jgi:hypothetical protein
MTLNIKADISALETWAETTFAGPSATPAAKAAVANAAPSIAAASSGVVAAEEALEDALDALADGMAEEAIAKFPGGELAIQFGGSLLTSFIAKLIDKGVHLVPGWQAPSLTAPAAPAAATAVPLAPSV